jgi:hypothetical protein
LASNFLLFATCRSQFLSAFSPLDVFPLLEQLFLIHFMRVLDVNIGLLLVSDHSLLLLVFVEGDIDGLADLGGYFELLEVLSGTLR